jgi:hypothetical protein
VSARGRRPSACGTASSALRAALVVLAQLAATSLARAETLDFERDAPGAAPTGFEIAQTGPGAAPRWELRDVDGAPSGRRVLVQASDDATRGRFPLAVYTPASFSDGKIEVRFEALSGKIDQAAGIVWRYRDANNYYLVRANALEGNVVLYKVEAGVRSDLDPVGAGLFAYGKKAEVRSAHWHALGVEVKGDLFQVKLDGKPLFEVRDTTFPDAGKVGLWTKADSVTAFDDLVITPSAAPR